VIRLIVAAVVWIALQPAAATGTARADERTIAVVDGGAEYGVPPSPSPSTDRHLDSVVAAGAAASLALGGWSVVPRGALDSVRMVARLWLRGQRLLC
jgi:hypothetical protein